MQTTVPLDEQYFRRSLGISPAYWERVIEAIIARAYEELNENKLKLVTTHVAGNCGAMGLSTTNLLPDAGSYTYVTKPTNRYFNYYKVERNGRSVYLFCGKERDVLRNFYDYVKRGPRLKMIGFTPSRPTVGVIDSHCASAIFSDVRQGLNDNLTVVQCPSSAEGKDIIMIIPDEATFQSRPKLRGSLPDRIEGGWEGGWLAEPIPDRGEELNMGGIFSDEGTFMSTREDAASLCLSKIEPGDIRFVSGVSFARRQESPVDWLLDENGKGLNEYLGSQLTSAYLNTEALSWTEIAPGAWNFNTIPNLLNRNYGNTIEFGSSYMCIVYKGDTPPEVKIKRVTKSGGRRMKCKVFPLNKEV